MPMFRYFMNKKDFLIDKHAARIDFGCLIAGFAAEQIKDLVSSEYLVSATAFPAAIPAKFFGNCPLSY